MNNTPTPRTDEKSFEDDTGYEVVSVDFARQLETELTAVTEQRDRLAEALNRISEYQGVDDEDPQTMAIEALQSLNQPQPTKPEPR